VKTTYIAVGSLRRPKLNAVWEAVSVFGAQLDPQARFEVVGVEVVSGVHHTPFSREELMAGARQRAAALVRMQQERAARGEGPAWEYFVGLEGGLDVVGQTSRSVPSTTAEAPNVSPPDAPLIPPPAGIVFLENWAYVCDSAGRGSFGQSGAIAIPEPLAARVVDDGVELAAAIDEYAGGRGIRDAQGAWGVLTANMITRQDAFRTAVINAFAPFFNAPAYQWPGGGWRP
jgi:non-canonical (house-cleaning) NTP pyrophosphatase